MVYVDDMLPTPPNCPPWRYRTSCHLMADTDAELEAFAKQLGLRQSWRHYDHYDLTQNKRRQAVEAGAMPITQREMVRVRLSVQAAAEAAGGEK